MNFDIGDKAKEVRDRVAAFMTAHVYPNEEEMLAQIDEGDRWQPIPLLDELKAKARAEGLWNLFLPESDLGAGLSNLDYAPACEEMGRSPLRARGLQLLGTPTPATWRCWSVTVPRRSASSGSPRCSPVKSAPPSP